MTDDYQVQDAKGNTLAMGTLDQMMSWVRHEVEDGDYLNCRWVDATVEQYLRSVADESQAMEHFLGALEGVELPVLKKLEELGKRFNAEGN